jgi:ATP-dependent helicase/nuclease subunit B
LDLQQARGLAFEHVVILGFHEGALPRRGREDPLLSDSQREELGAAVSRPIPQKTNLDDEERWLLALALGSARNTIVVSSQRRDEKGRPRNPSAYARDLQRLDPAAFASAERVPAHPASAAEYWLRRGGAIPPRRALETAALLSAKPREAVARACEALSIEGAPHALAHLETIERFDATQSGFLGESLSFDGLAEPWHWDSYTATGLDKLGRCPLQFFFHEALRVRAAEELDGPDFVDQRMLGIAVHRALDAAFSEEILSLGDPSDPRVEQAIRQRIVAIAREEFAKLARARLRGFDAVAAALSQLWQETIAEAALADIKILREEGATEILRESAFRTSLRFGAREAAVEGRIDRVARTADGERVTDYKTGRADVAQKLGLPSILRGKQLQLAIYGLVREAVTGSFPSLELVRVAPQLGVRERDRRKVVAAAKLAPARARLARALETLLTFAEEGKFPITLDDDDCKYCEYRKACRRAHVPTRERHASAPQFADYYGLSAKETSSDAAEENDG